MITVKRVHLLAGLLVAASLAAGCAGSKPAAPPAAPAVDTTDQDRAAREAEDKARAAREAAEAQRKAAEEAARKTAEAARQAAMARTFGPVLFDYDSFRLREDANTELATYAERLTAHPDFTVTLEGHCDERGTTAYNLALGQKRAESVRSYLVRAGVGDSRLTTISYGKERPADPGKTEAAFARNRRVELVVGQ